MVRILANGEIVADDDPRGSFSGRMVQDVQPNSRFHRARPNPMRGRIQQDGEVVAHGPTPSIFTTLNGYLTGLGIPTWNIGPYPVPPIASLGFLLSLVFFGFGGLFFAGLLFFVVQISQTSGLRMPAFLRRLGFGGADLPTQNPAQVERPAPPRESRSVRFGGVGHRLGDS